MKARADMESARPAAPIVTSGKREAAGRVIGVKRGGGDLVGHDERSISTQGWDEVTKKSGDQAGSANAVRVTLGDNRAAP